MSDASLPDTAVLSLADGGGPRSPFDDSQLPVGDAEEQICDDDHPIALSGRYLASSSGCVDTPQQALSYWIRAVAGVTLAGGAFGLPFFIVGGVFGFLLAGFFSMALVVPFALAVRFFFGRWRHPLAAPCFGGLVGFVPLAGSLDGSTPLLGAALFAMATTLFGMSGGYIATRDSFIEMVIQRKRMPSPLKWQFSIRAALLGMTSAAITLALASRWEPLRSHGIYDFALWLPWQAALLCVFARFGSKAAARAETHVWRFT